MLAYSLSDLIAHWTTNWLTYSLAAAVADATITNATFAPVIGSTNYNFRNSMPSHTQ